MSRERSEAEALGVKERCTWREGRAGEGGPLNVGPLFPNVLTT